MSMDWNTLEHAFEQLLAVDPSARESWLKREYDNQPELQEALMELLRAHEAGSAPFDLSRSLVEEPAHVPATSLVGHTFGNYKVISVLGRGGMGTVYLGERIDGQYQEQVAIKLVSSASAGEHTLRAIKRERDLLSRLNHPNITKLLDAGETDSGDIYLVTEYVQGQTITDYCEQSGLTTRQRVELLKQVAGAVAYAHQRQILHRDIKPSNVLVTQEGIPKLLDFGIAKLLDTDAADESATLARVMTPDYASPEQLLGNELTLASDVYALGLLLHEMLTGERARKLEAKSVSEMIRILQQRDESGSISHTLMDSDLALLVATATRTDTKVRYATADAFISDLQNWLDLRPLNARPLSWAYQIRKLIQRHQFAAISAGIAVLALLAATGVSIHMAQRAAAQRDAALVAQTNAEAAVDFLSQVLNVGSQFDGRDVTVRELLVRAQQNAVESFDQQLQARGDVLYALGEAQLSLGELDAAQRSYEHAYDARLEALGPANPDTIFAHTRYAYLTLRDEQEKGLALMQEAYEIAIRDINPEQPIYHWAVGSMATVYSNLRQFEKADPLFRQAIEGYQSIGVVDCDRLGMMTNNYAYMLSRNDRLDEAIETALVNLESCSLDPDVIRRRLAYQNVGRLYAQKGDHEAALPYLAKSYQIAKNNLTPEHGSYILATTNYFSSLEHLQDFSQLETVTTESWEFRRAADVEHDAVDVWILGLRSLANQISDPDQSASDLALAKSLFEKNPDGPASWWTDFAQKTIEAREAESG